MLKFLLCLLFIAQSFSLKCKTQGNSDTSFINMLKYPYDEQLNDYYSYFDASTDSFVNVADKVDADSNPLDYIFSQVKSNVMTIAWNDEVPNQKGYFAGGAHSKGLIAVDLKTNTGNLLLFLKNRIISFFWIINNTYYYYFF